MNGKELIRHYLLGDLDAKGIKELDRLLLEDTELRKEYRLATEIDSALRETAIERSIEEASVGVAAKSDLSDNRMLAVVILTAVAATVLFAVGSWFIRPMGVATLITSENAAWESVLPTNPGAELVPGSLHLKSGVATIRFHSGAEVVIEAPTHLSVISKMRARLESGAALLDVPDSATGFVLETPDGYAIDYGTKFAVRVDRMNPTSDYELIEGEIEVHHPASGNSLRLTKVGNSASVTSDELLLVEPGDSDGIVESQADVKNNIIRIGTDGRCGTAMPRNHKRHKFINPEVLQVRKSKNGDWDFRCFFDFDLSTIDRREVVDARLRLNLVPSTRGLASRLPKINRFAVYGLTDFQKADWDLEPQWEESPAPEDGVLLGYFEIERSLQRGTFGIRNEKLSSFVREHPQNRITLIVVRETGVNEGDGAGMVHMFASDEHPESVGPLMELTLP